jgi:hypothetical protein
MVSQPEDGGEVAKTARLLLHDGGPLPSISSNGLEEELATDQSRPFPSPSPSWRESTTTGRMRGEVGVLLEDRLFWVLGFFSVLRSKALFAYGGAHPWSLRSSTKKRKRKKIGRLNL